MSAEEYGDSYDMIIVFDDDATVYSPTLSIYGAPIWTFSGAFVGGKIIELVLALYPRILIVSLYCHDLIANLPARMLSTNLNDRDLTINLNPQSTTLKMRTKP